MSRGYTENIFWKLELADLIAKSSLHSKMPGRAFKKKKKDKTVEKSVAFSHTQSSAGLLAEDAGINVAVLSMLKSH